MRTHSFSEARRRFGETFSIAPLESVMLRKNGEDTCLAFSVQTGRRLILGAYAGGALSRSDAMQLLGLEWYGDLLEALDEQRIARPTVSDEVREQMVADAIAVLGDPEARSEKGD